MNQETNLRRGRIFAFTLLSFQIAMFFVYGFQSQYLDQTTYSFDIDQFILYLFIAMLTILGYGLLLSSCKDGAMVGMVTTLLVVAVSVQLSPIWQKIWYIAFNNPGSKFSTTATGFSAYYQTQILHLNLYNQRVTMAMICSLLLSFTGFIGKLDSLQILVITIVFNIGWTLSFMLCVYLDSINVIPSSSIFDDYGATYIYVFGSCFGIVPAFVLASKRFFNEQSDKVDKKESVYVSMIGTGFIFATFPFTGILYPDIQLSNSNSSVIRNYLGPLNIYFAMTASVICTYISSLIFGKGKVGVRQSLVGTISGGFAISSVAGYIPNIGACFAIGGFSGLLSGFWLKKIHPLINRNRQIDYLGLFGPILLNAIVGALIIAPATVQIMINLGTHNSSLPSALTSSIAAEYSLAFFGIAVGCGIVTGIIASFFLCYCLGNKTTFKSVKMISPLSGLYDKQESQYSRNEVSIEQHLRKERRNLDGIIYRNPHLQIILQTQTNLKRDRGDF